MQRPANSGNFARQSAVKVATAGTKATFQDQDGQTLDPAGKVGTDIYQPSEGTTFDYTLSKLLRPGQDILSVQRPLRK